MTESSEKNFLEDFQNEVELFKDVSSDFGIAFDNYLSGAIDTEEMTEALKLYRKDISSISGTLTQFKPPEKYSGHLRRYMTGLNIVSQVIEANIEESETGEGQSDRQDEMKFGYDLMLKVEEELFGNPEYHSI